jgi:hypothetical protein
VKSGNRTNPRLGSPSQRKSPKHVTPQPRYAARRGIQEQRPCRADRNEQRAVRALARERGVSYQTVLNEIRVAHDGLIEMVDANERPQALRRLAGGRQRLGDLLGSESVPPGGSARQPERRSGVQARGQLVMPPVAQLVSGRRSERGVSLDAPERIGKVNRRGAPFPGLHQGRGRSCRHWPV